MNEDRLQATEQAAIRRGLRVGGLAALTLGLLFTIIGNFSFWNTSTMRACSDREARASDAITQLTLFRM